MKKKLKEVCAFYSGTGFPTQYQGEIDGEYPFYKVGDIANNAVTGKTYLELCNNYISKDVAKIIKGCILPKDTVVFAKIGEALKLNRRAITSRECLIDNNAMGIAPKTDYLRIQYFYFFMRNLKMQTLAESTTVPSVRKTKLENYEIEVPSLTEQKRIEKKLTLIGSIIKKRKEELSILDNLIKARFVEVFRIWENKYTEEPLNEFLENITYGFTNPMPDTEEGPWKITAKDVVDGKINFNTARKTSQESYNKLTAKSKPQLGNVLLTKDGTLGRTAVVDRKNICVNQSVAVLRVNGRIAPDFLSVLLQMPKYQDCMMANAGGGTIKHIYITKIIKMLIIVPTMEEQKVFLDFVHQVDKSKVVA